MDRWLKNLIMILVLMAWLVYVTTFFLQHHFPSTPVMTIPGVTWALLNNRFTRISVSKEGLEVGQGDEKNGGKNGGGR